MDNHKPIAVASIISKDLERILFNQIHSTDNQLGFKTNHGTESSMIF